MQPTETKQQQKKNNKIKNLKRGVYKARAHYKKATLIKNNNNFVESIFICDDYIS